MSRVNPLKKKAKKGFKGYPLATIAYYGPDDTFASKVVAAIVIDDSNAIEDIKKWHSEDYDLRKDLSVLEEILTFIKQHHALSVAIADRIIGCPHEEGIDYPEGQACPSCVFWKDRDRFTGERI